MNNPDLLHFYNENTFKYYLKPYKYVIILKFLHKNIIYKLFFNLKKIT